MPTRRLHAGLLGLALALVAVIAVAAGPRAVRKQIESSMLITGSVDIAADGRVEGHRVDHPDKLPPAVRQLISDAVPNWRFEPIEVDGRPTRARAPMSVRIVAKKQEDGNFQVGIRSAAFGSVTSAGSAGIKAKSMPAPRYPEAALRMGIKGTVYLILKISPQGTVEDAFAEQVNLRVVGDERQMARGRDLLSRSALQIAKSWTFDVPQHDADSDELSPGRVPLVRVPIAYLMTGEKEPQYGDWETYVAGPTAKAPWLLEDIDPSFTPDAQLAGTLQPVDDRAPRLLTRLDAL